MNIEHNLFFNPDPKMRFASHIKILVVLILFEFARSHTYKKCPNGLMLNEVQSFGQQRGVMTNWQPFIEVARSTKDPISLENYSIVVYSVTHKVVKLRALIDLKTANLMQDQSLVVIRDGFFPNKLISIDMRSSDEIFFN